MHPLWSEEIAHANAEEIKKMEEERRATDARRQRAKEAFMLERRQIEIVELRRQDLAMARILEHNEGEQREGNLFAGGMRTPKEIVYSYLFFQGRLECCCCCCFFFQCNARSLSTLFTPS